MWFRRDLRISDNAALSHAAGQRATEGVVALFVVTPKQWKQHDEADAKVSFWLENLRALADDLARLRIPLLVRTCDDFGGVPQIVVSVAREHQCTRLFFNREYEVNESRRDARVIAACEQSGIEVHSFHDRIVVPPDNISTRDGRFYAVFTPYRRVWGTQAMDFASPFPDPRKQSALQIESSSLPSRIPGFEVSNSCAQLWRPGASEAQRRLESFKSKISKYHQARDIPSEDGTSCLSPYLAAGVISPRACLLTALSLNRGQLDVGDQGPVTWISELTWRDFYTHVLVGFPRVSMGEPFKQKTRSIQWRTDTQEFEAWCRGQTGYPIVDAGMRQLNQTGWMHNRLRMVTAMFLTKHLMIDWRWGERYFMQRLMDGDLAANNGGWQWSASTGTDAVPYFRIFNPFSQSRRFDPQGTFIKQYCPELGEVPAAVLHDARKLTRAVGDLRLEYPQPIVEHQFARQRVLAAFKAAS